MMFIPLPKNPAFVRALRLNRELKIQIAGLAGQLADAVLNDRVARFIAVGDRIAEALDFFLHPLERQLAALLPHVEMFVDDILQLPFEPSSLVAASFADPRGHLMCRSIKANVLR